MGEIVQELLCEDHVAGLERVEDVNAAGECVTAAAKLAIVARRV
jgi:hypothetical protein